MYLPSGALHLAWAQFFSQLAASAAIGDDAALMAAFEGISGSAGAGLAINQHTQAALPSLGAGDAGYLAWVTDYNHLLYWNGTAWQWGPGENGSGYIQFFAADPGSGWKFLDGTGNPITYLKSDGTTAQVNIQSMANTRYVQGGTVFTGADIPATATDVPVGTATAATGTAVTVASSTHTHVTGTPKSMVWLPYFRK
jgi:hypothetical protein